MPFKTPDVRVSRGRISRERGGKSTRCPYRGVVSKQPEPSRERHDLQGAVREKARVACFRVLSARASLLRWNSTEEDKRIRNSRSER